MLNKDDVKKELEAFADTLTVIGGSYIRSAVRLAIEPMKEIEAVPVIRCKNCIHKPKPTEDYNPSERDSGFDIEFPDYMCPLQCEDAYYSRLPKDDWFCGNAERRQDVQNKN